MDSTRYNIFQRLMRQWDSLHPYNAAQAVRLAGHPDADALTAHWLSALRELGLGPARPGKKHFQWDSFDAANISSSLIHDGSGEKSFDELMTQELNRPFDNSTELPFRPFVVRVEQNSYLLGIVYHHWVADSFSIRMLLREWLLRVIDPSSARRRKFVLARDGYWKLFGPDAARWNIDTVTLAMCRWTAQFRQARRIKPEGFSDLGVHFSLHHAPAGLITRVVSRAKQLGVTVNDVFLAAMAEICSLRVVEPANRKRRDVVLGTIVDLRSRLQDPKMNETFGMYLGFTSVFCRSRDLTDWDRLLARVHQQNDMQKRLAGAESSMARMLSGLIFARMFSREGLLEFYRKRYAIAGGISNVNMNRDWPAKYHPWPVLDYVRVSPLGPMMPLVFTPTTLGKQLNFGLTCRGAALAPAQANELADMFLKRLEWFANTEEIAARSPEWFGPPVRAVGY